MEDACKRRKNFEDPEMARTRNGRPNEKVESVWGGDRERERRGRERGQHLLLVNLNSARGMGMQHPQMHIIYICIQTKYLKKRGAQVQRRSL
jgi:hypothetical protein